MSDFDYAAYQEALKQQKKQWKEAYTAEQKEAEEKWLQTAPVPVTILLLACAVLICVLPITRHFGLYDAIALNGLIWSVQIMRVNRKQNGPFALCGIVSAICFAVVLIVGCIVPELDFVRVLSRVLAMICFGCNLCLARYYRKPQNR